MLPILQVGPLAVQLPGLLLLLGIWLGLWLAEKEALRVRAWAAAAQMPPTALSPDDIYNLALIGLLAGLLGARLAHAARFSGAYLADPLSLLSLSPATLAPAEGILIGVLAAVVYGSRKRLALRPALEGLAPFVAVVGVASAAAHLASGDAFGAPTNMPWRIFLWDDYRHPSQLYELAGALAVLGAWFGWTRGASRRGQATPGAGFVLVIGLSAGMRVLFEAFRGDSLLLAGGLRAAQVWGMVVLGGCLAAWRRLRP